MNNPGIKVIENKMVAHSARVRALAEAKIDNQINKATSSPDAPVKVAKSKLSGKPMIENLNKIAKWLKHFEKQDQYKPAEKIKIELKCDFKPISAGGELKSWRDDNNNRRDGAFAPMTDPAMELFRKNFCSEEAKRFEVEGPHKYERWQQVFTNLSLREQLDRNFSTSFRDDEDRKVEPKRLNEKVRGKVFNEILEREKERRIKQYCFVSREKKSQWPKKFEKVEGTLLWFDFQSQYGFIRSEHGNTFCHLSGFKVDEFRHPIAQN